MRCLIHAAMVGAALLFAPLAAQAEGISTHVLDISEGVGRANVPVTLMMQEGDSWATVGSALTESNGRVESFGEDIAIEPGTYKMVFDMSDAAISETADGMGTDADVMAADSLESFFPEIDVVFSISDVEREYHIPILVSPYGYSTYLGN